MSNLLARYGYMVQQNGTAEKDNHENLLVTLLSVQEKLQERVKEQIEFVQPIVKYRELDLFYPKSINVIQGKMGAHKSRFAGDVAALLLSKELKPNIVGLNRTSLYTRPSVVYLDTERNLTDQLPYGIQNIICKAGYTLSEPPENFHYTSLINVQRKDRQQAIKEYIEYMRSTVENHLVFFIDVLTDIQGDFNSIEQTYTLMDYLNVLINEHRITFFLVVHENPFNEKARGHAGTEGGNKASSLVSVTKESGTNLIKVDPLKVRNGPNDWEYHLKWSDQEHGLVEATGEEVVVAKNNKSGLKVTLSETLQLAAKVLSSSDQMSKSDLIASIRKELLSIGRDVSKETIKGRFDGINNKTTIQYDGNTYRVAIEPVGKHKMFSLQGIKEKGDRGNR